MQQLRHGFRFFDNNNFITSWILNILMECHEHGFINLRDDGYSNSFNIALDGIRRYIDPNFKGIPIIDFWPSQINNHSIYYQSPTNIGHFADDLISFLEKLRDFLRSIDREDLFEPLKKYLSFSYGVLKMFNIPGDFDDTSVTISLGVKLRSVFPEKYLKWKNHYNHDSRFKNLWIKYAYEPFSRDINKNSIDPRTYYWIRGFLDEFKNKPRVSLLFSNKKLINYERDIKLISTWAHNLNETIEYGEKGVKMPFNSNNIDATVTANGVHSLIVSLLKNNNENEWFNDPYIIEMLEDSCELLVWALENDKIRERPDLTILYYPPIYDFYWFVGRINKELNEHQNEVRKSLLLSYLKERLNKALKIYGTKQLLEEVIIDNDENIAYWDDFLGNNDTDINGNRVNNAEDRLFSTSIAVNALIDTWAYKVRDESSREIRLQYFNDTPIIVKDIIKKSILFLNQHILSGVYRPDNSFFSGSMKDLDTYPFFYPSNYRKYMNGTDLPPNPGMKDGTKDVINVVSGYIPKDIYENMLNQKWFGGETPRYFKGWNSDPSSTFPYWTSTPLTYSVALLAIGKFSIII